MSGIQYTEPFSWIRADQMIFEIGSRQVESRLRLCPEVGLCSVNHFGLFGKPSAPRPLLKKRFGLVPDFLEIVGLSAIQEADAFVLRSADIAPHSAEEVINLRFRDWSRMWMVVRRMRVQAHAVVLWSVQRAREL